MVDLSGGQELQKLTEELQESFDRMLVFYGRLKLFLYALKRLHNPDVDKVFGDYQVEIKEE